MVYSPLAIKRRHVLGDIYDRCDSIESIPIFLEDESGEALGHVDESLGKFTDAFLFHLPEDVCKKLSTSHYKYSFNFDFSDDPAAGSRKRIKLSSIVLIARRKPA